MALSILDNSFLYSRISLSSSLLERVIIVQQSKNLKVLISKMPLKSLITGTKLYSSFFAL